MDAAGEHVILHGERNQKHLLRTNKLSTLLCQFRSDDMNMKILFGQYFLITVVPADLNTKAARISRDMGSCTTGLLETVYLCAL